MSSLRGEVHSREQGYSIYALGQQVILKAGSHCSFGYSALASFRMGMSGSASFQMWKKSW